MLQYITDSKCGKPAAQQISDVVEGGCRWILISTKDIADEEIKATVEKVMPLCVEKSVFLLLESKVELAKELNVGGVFLRKGDMPCSKARMILGPAAVIGVEANSMADIVAVSNLDIDYFSLQPFTLSDDYEGDMKPLGIEGIRRLSFEMAEKDINIAHVAAGGIKYDDVLPLLEAGVNGIAVSEAIANSEDMVKETEKFVKALPVVED